jgi:hypothetical protein
MVGDAASRLAGERGFVITGTAQFTACCGSAAPVGSEITTARAGLKVVPLGEVKARRQRPRFRVSARSEIQREIRGRKARAISKLNLPTPRKIGSPKERLNLRQIGVQM